MTGGIKLGVGSYAFAWNLGAFGYPEPKDRWDVFRLVEEAGSLGADVLQLADNVPLLSLEAELIADIGRRSRELGIALEVGVRGVETDHLARCLEVAVALDADLVRTIVGVDTRMRDIESELDHARHCVEIALPRYEEHGVTIALENYETLPVERLRRFVEEIDSPFVGVCLDPVNSFGWPEDQRRVLDTLAPVTVNVHVKDFQIRRQAHAMGFVVEGAPVGDGRLDIRGLLARVARYRPRGFSAIVETWPPFQGDVEETAALERDWAIQSLVTMRRLMKHV